jgi:hypothetical protein
LRRGAARHPPHGIGQQHCERTCVATRDFSSMKIGFPLAMTLHPASRFIGRLAKVGAKISDQRRRDGCEDFL